MRINAIFIGRFLGLFKDAEDIAVYMICDAVSSTYKRIYTYIYFFFPKNFKAIGRGEFGARSRFQPVVTQENHRILSQGSRYPGPDFYRLPLKSIPASESFSAPLLSCPEIHQLPVQCIPGLFPWDKAARA